MTLHLTATGCHILSVTGCEDRLRNDLYCVGWGVILCSIQSTWHVGLHSVTCHPTPVAVNTPRLNHSQRPVLDLRTVDGWKAELT